MKKESKENKVTINLGLVNGRHEIPNVEGYVFTSAIDPKRMQWQKYMDTIAFNGIWNICFHHYKNGESGYLVQNQEDGDLLRIAENVHINLYVTGMTVALITSLRKSCKRKETFGFLFCVFIKKGDFYYGEI